MRTFSEILATKIVTVSSPDGRIGARLRGSEVDGFEFQPGAYPSYTDTELANQLEQLARLIAVARRRARREALREALGEDFEPRPKEPTSTREAAVKKEQDATVVLTETDFVRVRTVGVSSWRIKVRPGTTANVPEETFKREVIQAAKRAFINVNATMHNVRYLALGPSFILKGITSRP